jgi:hypothetical protein
MLMNLLKLLLLACLLGFATSGLVGCEEEGPMERAGERADEAVEEVGEEVEEAGEEIEEAVDDATDDR